MRRSSRLTAAGVAIALLVSGCSAASHPAAAGKPAAATGAGTGPGWSEHAAAGGVAAQVAGHGWTVALRAPGPVGSTLTLGDPGARPELPAARAALGTLAKAADVAAGDPVAVELAGGALPAAGATLTRTLSTSVPANARATLAYYDPTHDAWTAWPTTLSADRRTLTAPVSHFTIVDDIVYGAGWLLDTRTGAPSCPGAVPAWARAGVTFLDDLNAPLRWCVGADPADANELLVKVAVNRGYGVTVTPKATPARVADSIFNGATDDVLVRIMAGALSLPNNFGRGVLLVPGGATAELAFSEAAVRAAGGHPLISVNAAAEYMVAGMTYTAITKAYGDGDGPAAVVIALLAVAQCITSFGPALVAGDFSAAAAAALKCLASNAEDIGRDLASVLAKQFPKVAAEDLGKVAGRVGGHLWQVWAAGLVFGVATWFADQKLDGAAWTLNVFPKALPPPAPSFVGEWYVHGSTLSIESVTSGHEETNVGPCAPLATLHDPTGPMCHERVTYRFTLSADGRALTATVTSVSVVEAGTAISRPEVVATGKVGDSFTLTFVAPNQLIRSPWILGNPYLCNAKTPAQYQNRCGA